MKFFHVYNEECFKGLERNDLINKDTGFKIQHVFSLPESMLFNQYAQKGSKLYNLLKDGNHPFYVDRIAGGVTYYNYKFDHSLIQVYKELLGEWFLGFQMHESASNRRNSEWPRMIKRMGSKGPYDASALRKTMMSNHAKLPDGTYLPTLSHDTPEYYAGRTYAETYPEFIEEVKEMFARRLADTSNAILPCDSYFLLSKLQDEMGMRTFMPEVGCQIPMMRIAVSLARGTAKASGKTWGAYYECWRAMPNGTYSMPCFNSDPGNEWYLTQELHPDDFTSFGENGGSSRLLQNRIYYYALMSGADYFSEEWGLNCSYADMQTFELSHYGQVKKAFIHAAEKLQGIQAVTPFAIVLPKKYICVELPDILEVDIYENGKHRGEYMRSPLDATETQYFGHIEDVLKLFFGRSGQVYGNEGHVMTNSRFGDLFDIIYEDADDQVLSRYAYLIDATEDGSFAKAKAGSGLHILESRDLAQLEAAVHGLEKACMPCTVDGLHWLVSTDEKGQKYLTIFNNEGNERDLQKGNILHRQADQRVKVSLREKAQLRVVQSSGSDVTVEQIDGNTAYVTVPAAGFVLLAF